MRLSVRDGGTTFDVDVTVVDPEVSIGEVFTALTGRPPRSTITVDGWPYRSTDAVGSLPLHHGSIIDTTDVDDLDLNAGPLGGPSPASFRLTKVGGEAAGRSWPLDGGIADVGRGSVDDLDHPEFRLELTGGRSPAVSRIGELPVFADGEPILRSEQRSFERIRVGPDVFRADERQQERQLPLPVSETGRLPHQRPPRRQRATAPTAPTPPEPPSQPKDAGTFSWVVMLVPIPLAIGAVFFFRSPFFLFFILMSPILAGGRYLEGKRRASKDAKRYASEVSDYALSHAAALRAWRVEEHRHRYRLRPDIGQLIHRIDRRDPRLWERRPDHDDFLTVDIGLGDVDLAIGSKGQGQERSRNSPLEEVDAVRHAANRLGTVPITIDLEASGAIGIVGDRRRCRDLAAALLLQVAIGQGPADVLIGLLLEPRAMADWDWIKWIPHLEDGRGFRHLAIDEVGAATLLGSFPVPIEPSGGHQARHPGPVPVIAVDGARFLAGNFTALSTAVRSGAARAIVIAERASELPAICSIVIDIDRAGTATATSMVSGSLGSRIVPVLLDRTVGADVARQLSAFSDPERADEGSGLPQHCDLRSLIGGQLTPDAVLGRWGLGQASPTAIVGVAQHGPLTLDLVNDGPHALVAGTTGSGKSELLRTLIASLAWEQGPDRLNFVLVDFKGGGAFDACADLPHTVGVVTDLDDHLAARALRCLKAELRYRERKLRDAEVSDLRDYDNPDEPLARLVVIVDEFATLAAELPDFMASLVDIAQRGRSLGIHMILATQRPSGVVDAKIRANTNLRISLRVQDMADSEDVIGDRRASSIDRRAPGRGYARFGASELVQFQTALVSAPTSSDTPQPLRITTFELSNNDGVADQPAGSEIAVGGPTDLEALAEATTAATAKLGLAPARVPWPAPLPPVVEASLLPEPVPAGSWTAPIGLADLPDEQRTETYWWTPEVGNLAVYGTDSTATSGLLETLVLGLARRHSSDEAHLYLIDFGGGGTLGSLARLPHVGAVVSPLDEERFIRVLDLLDTELTSRSETTRASGVARIGPDFGLPLLVVAIANYGAMMSFLEETNQFELSARFERLVRDGPGLGLFVVATTNHERGIPARVAGQIESRLILRMADPNAYSAFGLRIRDMPDLGPGRAIDPATGLEIQTATYAEAGAIIADCVNGMGGPAGQGPNGVEVLGTDIGPEAVVARSEASDRVWSLAIGVRHLDLGTATVDLRPGGHLIVTGASGSGKSTALRGLALAARRADADCQLLTVGETDHWPTPVEDFDLDQVDPDRRTLILIDGISWVTDEMGKGLESLDPATNWIVVADWPEAFQSMPPPWLRRVLACRSGLLLQPQPDHGDVLRSRLPLRTAQEFPPGRGFLISAGIARLVQVVNAHRAVASS